MRHLQKAALTSVVTLVTLLGAMTHAANAATIRWHLNDFVFQDGGTATGYFDWDTVAGSSTNYAITISGGNTGSFPVKTYTDESTEFLQLDVPATLYFWDNPRVFRIGLASLDLLDTPTSFLALVGSSQSGPTGYLECFNCLVVRYGQTAGNAHLSAVPEPAVATLSLLGLGLAAIVRRRRAHTERA